MKDINYIYHYYEKNQLPFRTLTSLPFDEAKVILCENLADNETRWVDSFLNLRYERDKTLREKFISIGGKPIRTTPVYFTLGTNEGMKTWFDEPVWVKIPVGELDSDTVSFTYGDSFAVLNPSLDTGEEWWGKIFRYNDIVRLIDKYGYPNDLPYDMKNRIFPTDKNINHCLKFIEAHIWDDSILDKHRCTE